MEILKSERNTLLALCIFIEYPLTMNKKIIFFIFISVFAGLNLGTVRRAEDPVRDTQTNGILYEQKMEEEKDGKKGPLLYHVKNSPRETFFIDPPFEKETETPSSKTASEKTSAAGGTEGWWEEESVAPREASSAETTSGSLDESLVEAEKTKKTEIAEESKAVPKEQGAPSGKEDDYWW